MIELRLFTWLRVCVCTMAWWPPPSPTHLFQFLGYFIFRHQKECIYVQYNTVIETLPSGVSIGLENRTLMSANSGEFKMRASRYRTSSPGFEFHVMFYWFSGIFLLLFCSERKWNIRSVTYDHQANELLVNLYWRTQYEYVTNIFICLFVQFISNLIPAPAPSLNYRVKIKTKQFTLYSQTYISKSSIQLAINMFTKYNKCSTINKQKNKRIHR